MIELMSYRYMYMHYYYMELDENFEKFAMDVQSTDVSEFLYFNMKAFPEHYVYHTRQCVSSSFSLYLFYFFFFFFLTIKNRANTNASTGNALIAIARRIYTVYI